MRWTILMILLSMIATAGAAEPIRVGAAISLKEAMESIAAEFKRETGIDITLQFGSSGQLAAQIKAGAPIDLFVSAAERQVDDLIAEGLALPETRRVVAGNELVLIVPADAKEAPAGFEQLGEARFRRIAIGEPRTVPAGEYAHAALASLKLTERLSGRLVYGANVRQVLNYVARGEVGAGIVYKTDAMDAREKVRVVATAEARWHKPIVYPAVIVKRSARTAEARRFLDYVAGEKGRKLLAARGFVVPGE